MRLSLLHEALSTGAVAIRPAGLGQRPWGGTGEPRKAQEKDRWYNKFAKRPTENLREYAQPGLDDTCPYCSRIEGKKVKGQLVGQSEGKKKWICPECGIRYMRKAESPIRSEATEASEGSKKSLPKGDPNLPKTQVWQFTSGGKKKERWWDHYADSNNPDERLLKRFRGKGL